MSVMEKKFYSEEILAKNFIADSQFLNNTSIEEDAVNIIKLCRDRKSERTQLDAFLSEYGLSNNEGVALMCLAESLLRIPDSRTRNILISEKLSAGSWEAHLNMADSLLVNASTWGLLLAGKVIKPSDELSNNPLKWLNKLTKKSGEIPVREAIMMAMKILSGEFVMGRDFEDINKIKGIENNSYSFDMLGEAARTETQANNYYKAYEDAINNVSAINDKHGANNGISIKISALSPKYEMLNQTHIKNNLIPKLEALVDLAFKKDVEVTIDAEEQDRLSVSLEIIEKILLNKKYKDWSNIGMAVQAYGKRSLEIINWAEDILKERAPIHVRLVKGAYWDYEIKQSQIKSHPGYSVFTNKNLTDLSYLHTAKKIFDIEKIYPKFATHNAHTIAAIYHMGYNKTYEFQRLFGMGELLYDSANKVCEHIPKASIYAPIGAYKDLLPYLVRRLLENGANSSFINRLLDSEVDPKKLAENPAKVLESKLEKNDLLKIQLPKDMFNNRINSPGLDLTERENIDNIKLNLQKFKDTNYDVQSSFQSSSPAHEIKSLCDGGSIGSVKFDDPEIIINSLSTKSTNYDWGKTNITYRTSILKKMADLIQANSGELLHLLLHETGKTIHDAWDELREAEDFLRFYCNEANNIQSQSIELKGPTGELNEISYHPKGTFLCISPWNFPAAIHVGQISAALVTGNNVIAKPSEHASIIGFKIIELFHKAGVPKEALQLILGGAEQGDALSLIDNIQGVSFTGSHKTAKYINKNLASKEGAITPIIAETGGLNVMVVDSSALLEQVTDDVIRSAFNSAGQRCSALRLILVQEEIYEDMWEILTGAMKELTLDAPNNFETDVGPIINVDAFKKLETYINSFTSSNKKFQSHEHLTEKNIISPCLIELNALDEINEEQFGPILHIYKYKASTLKENLIEINDKNYGLTLGIHSRIESKHAEISGLLSAGNAYVNRDMVGAVVGVQPFGGEGLSGCGLKAGGPNYLLQFVNERVVSKNTVAFGGNTELLNLDKE